MVNTIFKASKFIDNIFIYCDLIFNNIKTVTLYKIPDSYRG